MSNLLNPTIVFLIFSLYFSVLEVLLDYFSRVTALWPEDILYISTQGNKVS